LTTIFLGDASFESVTELGKFPASDFSRRTESVLTFTSFALRSTAKNRSQKQGGPLSNLKVIKLEQAVASEWDELGNPSAEVPPWLVDHPVRISSVLVLLRRS